jgi:dolichol-phosphate mannosyltransferase
MRTLQTLSIVVPGLNEAESLPLLFRSLIETLGNKKWNFEIIFVDDGSTDKTLHICRALHKQDSRFQYISLSRNFGHQRALTAGLEYATGQAVGIIDADLQDPPEVFLEMIALWEKGVDVAYGTRRSRKGETFFKKITAKFFYRLISIISGVKIPPDTGDFRLIDQKVLQAIKCMPEQGRFLRGMIPWVGFRQEPVFYDRNARTVGETRYPLKKMLRFAWDGIASFSAFPLRLATWFGIIIFLTAILFIIGYTITRILIPEIFVPGWTALFIAIMAFGGLQMLFIGILGEYLAKCFEEAKRRPFYFINESSINNKQ